MVSLKIIDTIMKKRLGFWIFFVYIGDMKNANPVNFRMNIIKVRLPAYFPLTGLAVVGSPCLLKYSRNIR